MMNLESYGLDHQVKKNLRIIERALESQDQKKKSDVAKEHIDSYNDLKNYFFTIWIPLIDLIKNTLSKFTQKLTD